MKTKDNFLEGAKITKDNQVYSGSEDSNAKDKKNSGREGSSKNSTL
jgi:hypothetical protein